MSICKFNVGDLVHRRTPHNKSYWEGRVGIVVAIDYSHGNPSINVKWSRIAEVRSYSPKGIERVE